MPGNKAKYMPFNEYFIGLKKNKPVNNYRTGSKEGLIKQMVFWRQ